MRLLIAEDLRNPQGSTFCFHCGLRSLTHSLISVIPPNLMRTGKKSHLSYYSLGLSHPILYRSGGDSEAKYCLACFTLPDEEDERQGAVSTDGGGQGRAGQGRARTPPRPWQARWEREPGRSRTVPATREAVLACACALCDRQMSVSAPFS